jgi:glyoxylase-like metal-dependent hydrolase (beta-lactamase superfamily II)
MILEDEFCDIIKKARNGRGLSLDQIVEASGLEASALRELESGRRAPAHKEVLALAAALHLDGPKLAAIACDGWHPASEHPDLQNSVLTVHGDIGGYAVKGYLFYDPASRDAAMIDTGYNPEGMLHAIEQHRLRLTAVCLTHGHSDHADGIEIILDRYPVPVYIGKEDWGLLGWKPRDNLRKFVADGEGVTVGGKDLRFVTTPGHTPGGVCYRAAGCEFVGDTLFAGSIGRSNPSSLYTTHLESVRRRVLTLPDELTLLPGHGPATTVREEKDHNPFG